MDLPTLKHSLLLIWIANECPDWTFLAARQLFGLYQLL